MKLHKGDSSYQTLSDLGLATLGLLLFITVAVMLVSQMQAPYLEAKITQRMEELNDKIGSQKTAFEKLKKADRTGEIIEGLKEEYDKREANLERKRSEKENVVNDLKKSQFQYKQATQVVKEMDVAREDKRGYIAELNKVEPRLQSLVSLETGTGVDRTGRPHLYYGVYTKENYIDPSASEFLFLIGREGVFSKDQVLALIKSFVWKETFFWAFSYNNSKFNQDRLRPAWTERFLREEGKMKPVENLKIKKGYQ
jgi:lipopolysaccharide export LptBFGC system permease protein LptF